MPFRERLKSIVKGEAPVFGHHDHGHGHGHQEHHHRHHHRRWSSVSHHDVEHLARRPVKAHPQSHESGFNKSNRPGHAEPTIITGTSQTHGQFLKPEDAAMRRNESSALAGSREPSDVHILKDSMQYRAGGENFRQHHGQEAIVKDIGSISTRGGGAGRNIDKGGKALSTPPPTTASANKITTAQTTRDYNLTVPAGSQQARLEVTPDGVIQDKQAICESMIMDGSGNAKRANPTIESMVMGNFSNTKASGLDTNIKSKAQGTEGPSHSRYSNSPPSPLHGDPIGNEDLAAQGNMYTLPPFENNPFFNSTQDQVSATEGPSEYSITRFSTGDSEDFQDMKQTASPDMNPTINARDESCMQESKVPPATPTSKQNSRENTGEYYAGSFAGDSSTRLDDPAGTPRTPGLVPSTSNTPSREFHVPMVADYDEKKDVKQDQIEANQGIDDFNGKNNRVSQSFATTGTPEHHPHSTNNNINDPPYSSSTSTSTSARPRRYSTIHHIFPSTYQIDPDEGPIHRSVILGGRSSSILSSNSSSAQNYNYTNLREFGLDTNSGVYEITNFGGGKRAPVMGVEEEGDWYKACPERAGCFVERV